MVSLLPVLVLAMLTVGFVLIFLLPADTRKAFINPQTLGDRLLVRSVGVVAIVTFIWHFVGGSCSDKCGTHACSPCIYFGIYVNLVLFGQIAWHLWKRHAKTHVLPPEATNGV